MGLVMLKGKAAMRQAIIDIVNTYSVIQDSCDWYCVTDADGDSIATFSSAEMAWKWVWHRAIEEVQYPA